METGHAIEASRATEAAKLELANLRQRAHELEKTLRTSEAVRTPEVQQQASLDAVSEEWKRAGHETSPAEVPRMVPHPDAISLELAPEEHDEKMGEIIYILQEHGVTQAINAAEKGGNPHIIDDFHRILVEWVREGLSAKEATSNKYKVALSLGLYEITLPGLKGDDDAPSDPTKAMRDFIALMEQLYRGMLQMDTKNGEYFSFEIANPAGGMQTSVYIAVPKVRKAMFEKQLLSLFPAARLRERHDDYNAFVDGASTAATTVRLRERGIYSLRTADSFSSDPLDSLLNAFSMLDKTGEGAALQFVVSPRDKGLSKEYRYALEKVHRGVPLEHATKVHQGLHKVALEVFDTFFAPEKVEQDERIKPDDARLKNIENKLASPIFLVDIRIVASAATAERAESIVQEIEAPFQQFGDTAGNSLVFDAVPPQKIKTFAHAFSYRLLDEAKAIPLSALELATIAHLPGTGSKLAAPELQQEKAGVSAPPANLGSAGAVLGVNKFRGVTKEVRIAPEDRLRHLYVIGQTGTGKSTLLKNVIIQDIRSGAGVCMIDPHGSDVLDVLSAIPPERMDDVIYFDPGSTERPMGLNMLEFDPAHPEQKTLVVDELFGIFKKLFGAVPESMGPAFEQYFRNSALLVMEAPELGATLLDISRIFADPAFRAKKLAACKNPIVKQFWEDIASKTTGEQGLENYGPYVTNKFDVFTTNEIVRPIIAQQKSAFNFRDIMDKKKILLVNLAKGRIGDVNANLLGLVIVGKFLIAALSRADSVGKDLPPYYLHIDEFQNFTTPSIATIFSEARKYKLSLTVAHQFIAQLAEEIRDAVFGNVGSICSFRVGAADAEFLEKQFAPTFSQSDLMNVDNRNAYVRLLIDGRPATPFNIETLAFEGGGMADVEKMRELSALKYGRPRAEVEAEVARSFSGSPQEPATLVGGGL